MNNFFELGITQKINFKSQASNFKQIPILNFKNFVCVLKFVVCCFAKEKLPDFSGSFSLRVRWEAEGELQNIVLM
ncbi:MAG: hypothetical protein KA066_01510 [Candidatus Pacebacteria bacterium]|nr:hypothetical protein [Candidatus Paceibacterota bacterium]